MDQKLTKLLNGHAGPVMALARIGAQAELNRIKEIFPDLFIATRVGATLEDIEKAQKGNGKIPLNTRGKPYQRHGWASKKKAKVAPVRKWSKAQRAKFKATMKAKFAASKSSATT